MKKYLGKIGTAFAVVTLVGGVTMSVPSLSKSRVTVGATETISSHNPHGDSISMGYGIWCQVYGCLGYFDFKSGSYKGMLAERWETDKKNPNIWTFYLRKGLKRHNDGKELTSADVVHAFGRMKTDPQSRQTQNVKHVAKTEAVDKYTVRVTTKKPTAPLLEFLFDRVMITSKDLFDKHGAKTADRKYPWGWGPYKLKQIKIGQQIVLEKDKGNVFATASMPDELIFRVMREAEQRVTALLNKEIQIAQFIPPHLASRIQKSSNSSLVPTSSVELMFLAMSPKYKPYDNPVLRKAICHAINRDGIIKAILKDQAQRLDAPIGPGQYGYNAEAAAKMKVEYNVAKAKAMIEKAGLKGTKVELSTPVNRYVNDKQVTESMIPMLKAIGLDARLKTPEWPTLWANVQKGKVPFFYMGRGGVVDPSPAFAQYFEKGGSPRIGWSSQIVDGLLQKERATFDPEERKKVLNQAFAEIVKQQPACFMWRHKLLYGISKSIAYKPTPTGRIWGVDIAAK